MKELILEGKKEEIIFTEHTKKGDYCYGVVILGKKGWIQPTEYDSDKVSFFSLRGGVSFGNGWSSFRGAFNKSCEELLKSGDKIYQFNNEKELFKWLAE